MADLSRTIQIIFEGVDDTGGAFSSVGRGLQDFSDSVGNVTGPLADVSDKVLGATAAIGALGVAMLGWSINEAGEFRTATTEINTLIGLSPELMGKFEQEILDYSRTSTSSFEDINRAIYQAISTGTDYSEAIARIGAAEALADAGRGNLVDSTVLLAKTMNAYGATTEEVERFTDAFFKTIQVGATTLPELSASFSQTTGSAALLKIPIETLAAAFASVTAQGANTSEAATRINGVLAALTKPTSQAADEAARLGIEFSASAVQSRGLEAVLNDVDKATNGNAASLALLFGRQEAIRGVVNLTADGVFGLTAKMREYNDITGITAEAAAAMAATFELTNQRIANALREVGIRAGAEFLDTYQDIGVEIRNILYGISDGIEDGAFDSIIDLVNEFGQSIQSTLADVAKNLPEALELIDLGPFESSLRNLATAIGALFDGVDVSTPRGLADAIDSVVKVGSALINTAAGIVEGLKPFIDAIVRAAEAYSNADEDQQLFAGNILGLAKGIDAFLPAIDGLGNGIETLGNGLSLLAGSQLASVIASFVGPAGLNPAIGTVITNLGKAGLIGAASAAGYALGTELAGEIDKLLTKLTGRETSLGSEIYDLVDALDGIQDGSANAGQALTRLADPFTGTARAVFEFGVNLFDAKEKTDALKTAVVEIGPYDNYRGAIQELADSFKAIDTGELIAEFNALNPVLQLNADGTVLVAEAADKTAVAYTELTMAGEKWVDVGGGVFELVKTGTTAIDEQTEAVKQQAAKQKILNEASTEYLLGWQKILSEERVAIYELKADIDIARIEADANRTIAAFDAMAGSFENTGEVLTALFAIWNDASGFDQDQIGDWIEREYKIREDLAKSQISLVESEIRRMEAQTALLQRGGVEIKINSDGLEPALEAFMFSVIDKVRVQIAGSYEDFLLGCGS